MPRYFFNVFHKDAQRDQLGTELPDKHAAWEQATKTAGEILKELDGQLQPGKKWRLVVTDEFQQKCSPSTSVPRSLLSGYEHIVNCEPS